MVVLGTKMKVARDDPRWAIEGATDEQIRRAAQIQLAAEARLEHANQVAHSQRTGSAAAPENQPEGQTPGKPTGSQPVQAQDAPAPKTTVSRDKINEIVDRIQNGLPEDGAEALEELVNEIVSLNGGQSSQSDIQSQVERILVTQQNQTEIDGAVKSFAQENGDLMGNKHLRGALFDMAREEMLEGMRNLGVPDELLAPIKSDGETVALFYRQLRLDGQPLKTHGDLLEATGQKMRKTFNMPKRVSNVTTSPDATNKRVEAKRSMQPQPRSAGQRGQSSPQGPRPKTREEVVQEMRAARHFPARA